MIIQELSDAIGVSGNEEAVRKIIAKAVREHVDDLRTDTIGNLYALKKARAVRRRRKAPGDHTLRVMIAAHMDEVGLMIVGHDGGGGLRFRAVGGVDDRILPGKVVLVGPDKIPGVIGAKPVHLLRGDEGKRAVTMDSMVIDIGASSREEAEATVKLGQVAAFGTTYRTAGRTATGKAFDDRVGCAILVDLLAGERLPIELHAVFTVQEETGLRGARVAAMSIGPDCAFALEGSTCDDLPKEKDTTPTTRLGAGPAIYVADRGGASDRRLVGLLTSTADAVGIPYQLRSPGVGRTEASEIARSRAGVPAVAVGVPCRYMHSPVSRLSLDDLENTVRLMRESLQRLTPDVLAH